MSFHEAIAVIALSGSLVISIPPAGAAEVKMVPSLALAEEFNDNLLELPQDRRWDFITRVQPSLAVSALGGPVSADLSYGLDYRKYARGSRDDELNHAANMNTKFAFWDGLLQIDAGDTYSRVSLDVTRDTVTESLVVSQTEQNTLFISPYLFARLSGRNICRGGYRFSQTIYMNGSAIDREEQQVFAELTREVTPTLTITEGYSFVHGTSDLTSYGRHDLYGGFRFDFGEGNTLFGRIGNSWQSFTGQNSTSNLVWDAGATRTFGFMAATVRTTVQYTQDPLTLSTRQTSYSAGLTRSFKRGEATVSGSYSEYEATQSPEPERRYQTGVGATGRYELSPYLVVLLGISGDHVSPARRTDTNFPYRGNASFSIDYAMSSHTSLRFDYSHVSYRNSLGTATGSAEVNRFIVEMRMKL